MAEEFSDLNVNTNMTAGEILRMARTTGRRKREIQTIAKQLCIREEFLTALEDGNYTLLPETVYILGFARNYAMELGVDPDMIVAKIKKELGLVPNEMQNSHPVPAEKTEVARKPLVAEDAPKKVINYKEWRAYQIVVKYWMWFLGGLAVVAIIAVALVLVLHSGKKSEPQRPVVIETLEPMVEEPVKVEPAYQKPVRESFGTENKDVAEIILQATKESWVKIEDSRGKTIFSRVLVAGDVYYVPVGAKHKATFGNAGGIDIWVHGTLAPKAGADNTRKNGIVLDADALLGVKKDKAE